MTGQLVTGTHDRGREGWPDPDGEHTVFDPGAPVAPSRPVHRATGRALRGTSPPGYTPRHRRRT